MPQAHPPSIVALLKRLLLDMHAQPDDTACGPTCLQALYRYYGDELPLQDVIDEIPPLPGGGTLAVVLANHALKRGYHATLYTYNLQIFDPSWFRGDVDLVTRLQQQAAHKDDTKLQLATQAYVEFLRAGGELRLRNLTGALIRGYLRRERPILTGLSATYLYGCAREIGGQYDDVRGLPAGHFVVLAGYEAIGRRVLVVDPLQNNPLHSSQHYAVEMDTLVAAILLGIVTYDANVLIIEPR